MNNVLSLIGRETELFCSDIAYYEEKLREEVGVSKFLVLGGAGTIGQAVVKEIFKRNPKKLHLVDISENNLTEVVRDIRSSYGYINGDFRTFALDIGSIEYDAFIAADGEYDYVLNLSALKHVRSEKDPFTLMRMIDVNVLNTEKTILQSIEKNVKKYFCVSTDKAANPVNMMGASKRIMEMFLMRRSEQLPISTARFANVAFSDGSLLHGFDQRIAKQQPIAAPSDIRRYFLTPQESGELCLMSCLLGENRDIFFPKLSESLHLISFSEIAVSYLKKLGYEPVLCETEDEARFRIKDLPSQRKWPCIFTKSDTTGEKDFEEFYTEREVLDFERFENLGVIKNKPVYDSALLDDFEKQIATIKKRKYWNKKELVDLFFKMLPDFDHKETGKYLDSKM
ncbi:UDP-N-acetylglucosamine 4,6-dehydratase [Halodesulfovibrio marinisediminis]|uniref:Polysaccharide biosynthesis protein n=1 Tax=Halodesulfovibrio marinisediminis DSM 17456 TaxID=1121457 RepID=A0A1N6FT39_9BACT|nr:UDP-N-acetylglucosamine 4,6-dehydratase [Halodesulfovibrio marinisediminis]SIN98489.1 Polysaccharide biosynthesis protein [Halodesulfovibrio marinisediminis DSM 17456]